MARRRSVPDSPFADPPSLSLTTATAAPSPGVDVPIHLYSLYSDLKPDWTKLYAEQPEVLAYWEALVDKHQLRANFAFESEFVGSKWDEDRQAHTLTLRRTADGSSFAYEADVIISANGPLSKPTIPRIPGFETFEGKSFHNLRWDSSVELKNKRIAVLGNGSSGIQLIVCSVFARLLFSRALLC